MFQPIDNQAYAALAGAFYNTPLSKKGPLIYGITHLVPALFSTLKNFGPCVLLTSFSDSCVTKEIVNQLPANVNWWFSNNVMTKHPKVIPIPIGFAFNIVRENLLMSLVEKERLPEVHKMYVNFTRLIPRTPNPREGLYEMFGGLPWVTCKGGSGLNSVPPEVFYNDLRSHPFVLSPPGAGPDCHRHWEAMALGSIPIVLRSTATEILDDMPCLQVNQWDEVTPKRLVKEEPILRERFKHPSIQKLDFNYWKKEIQNAVDGLRHTP